MPCDERVGRGVVTYPCTLPPDHPGPHLSPDSPASIGDRRRWETAQADRRSHELADQARATLASFQGEAQTTAQRYTENPTPVPLSPGRRRMHMDCGERHGCIVQMHDECPHAEHNAPLGKQDPRESDPQVTAPPTFPLLHGDQADIMREEMETGRNGSNPGGLKQREGDQVLPTVNDHPDIQSQVIADIEARRQVGISRYGTALQPFNGRDTLRDAYEEAMDLTVYLRSLLTMKEALRADLVAAVAKAVSDVEEAQGVLDHQEVAQVAVDAILDAALLFEPGPVSDG